MEKPNNLMPDTGFYFISQDNHVQQDYLAHQLAAANAVLITPKWRCVPYLSLKDNVLLTNKEKNLVTLLEDVGLDETIFQKHLHEIRPLEEIQLQLLNALVQKKPFLILKDVVANLTTKDLQLLLPLCQQISKRESVSIYLISNDERIANTPYINPIDYHTIS